jgi:REP element-mobilizing transposase RayT
MANTYTQLYVHAVFAVKDRHTIAIPEINRIRIEKYICGIAKNVQCSPIAIYCNPDHLHFFFGIHPSVAISDVMRDIKLFSSRFINENSLAQGGHFEWQTGFGAFTYGHSQINNVRKYIQNQAEHHKKTMFREEYLAFLKAFEVEYDERYVFDFSLPATQAG